jgi:hypothetical protein
MSSPAELEDELATVRAKLSECYRIRVYYQEIVDELLDRQQDIQAKLAASLLQPRSSP